MLHHVRFGPIALSVVGLFLALPSVRCAPAAAAPDGSEDEKLLKAAKIGVAGPGLLDYFRQHTTTQAQQEHIQTLIRQLGDDSFKVRQAATTELAALGPTAVPYLRRALNDPDEELKERAENLIRTADGLEARAAQSAAAARLIRQRAPADAAAVLLAYTPDAESAEVEEEVVASLAVLAVHDGKVDAVVVAALKDKQANRRAAAGVVVGRSGTPEQRAGVQPLLADPDPRVRFRAAQGLLAGRDRAGIPALIALVKDGPMDFAFRSSELLSCAIGVRAPRVPFGEDPAARQACANAWDRWAKTPPNFVGFSRADADLPPFNPRLRARDVARQFFNALVVGDLNAFQKAVGVPFHMTNEKTYGKPEELANYFNENPLGLRNGQFSMALMGTVPLTEYIYRSTDKDEAAFGKAFILRPSEVVVLLVQQNQLIQQNQLGISFAAPDPTQGILFLIQLTGDRPRVIGVSPGRSKVPIPP